MEFQYTARNIKTQQVITSKQEAEDEKTLLENLRKQGLLPLKVHAVKQMDQAGVFRRMFRKGSVSTKDIVFFTRQLSATLKAGLLLTEALDIVGEDLNNQYFMNIIKTVREDINGGLDFTAALKKHPAIFSKTYILIIQTGELSGSLHLTLEDLAEYLEEIEEIREKIKSGLTYPLVLIVFTILIISGIVIFIIPKFKKFFDDSGQEIPLFTRLITNGCESLLNNLPIVVGGIVFLCLLLPFLARFKFFQNMMDDVKMKIPFVGPEIIHKSLVSRFCRTLGIMLGGGVTMYAALNILSEISDNHRFQKTLLHVKERVVSGSNLSDEISKQRAFPPLVGKMILIGEKTGKLEDLLMKTAYYYEQQVYHNLKRLLVIIEPLMVAIAGIFVAIIVVAVYLPIFNLISIVNF